MDALQKRIWWHPRYDCIYNGQWSVINGISLRWPAVRRRWSHAPRSGGRSSVVGGQSKGAQMQITGLDHVQLAMPEGKEAAARAFYVDVLGLREQAKPPELAGRGGCWFEGPGTALHLGVERPFAPARKAHPALRVLDFAEAQQALADAGTPFEPDYTLPGVKRLYVNDPFGNRIELIEGAPFGQP